VLLKVKSMNAMYPVRCRFATLVRLTRMVLSAVGNSVSVRETVDDHDSFVMWVVDACGFDDAVWSRWDADMVCSAGRRIFGNGLPVRGEL
jgi:hypothetical protein